MQVTEQTFSKIIQSENGNEHYHIPKYQRAYSWNNKNWMQLFDDIDENVSGHFIGSVICIHDRDAHQPGCDLVFEVIDGQQRMTTISLLLAAIYKKINSHIVHLENDNSIDEDSLDDIKAKRRSIGLQLAKKIKPEDVMQREVVKIGKQHVLLRVQPSSQSNNLEDYKFILSDCGALGQSIDVPAYFGNRMMGKAYRYFQERVPDILNEIIFLSNKINSLQLVHISVSSHSDAFRLFETLNNRGMPLTAVDIIKNKMLAEMERQHNVSIDDAYDQWQEMLEEIYEVEDRFLRHFYNAFKHIEKIGQPRFTTKATTSTLIAIYESMINGGAQFVFDQLVSKAKLYSEIIRPDKSKKLGEAFQDLNRIGAVSANILLLYLLALPDTIYKNKDTLLEFVEFLQKYYVRRNITDTPSTRDLDQLQIDVIDACESVLKDNQLITKDFLIQSYCKGRGQPADINEFRDNLSNNLFYYNKQMARYVLIKLDEIAHTREYKPDFWSRNDNDDFVWTVEHILPQGERIPQHWIDMIANGKKNTAYEIQAEWVHCLGNLTLSGYNSRLSNQSFDRKQTKTEATTSRQKIDIGYKNGLFLNELTFLYKGKLTSLSKIKHWTKESIASRNDKMVELLCDAYKFDHEK